MAEQTTKPTNEELINQMYDASLAGQKAQLEQTKDQGMADLQAEQERLQKQTDANLNRTYVEAARDQRNYAEIQNAYGLSSGAMAQARLAQDNQLEADLTALRGAQANIDANIEREKTMLSQQYMAAIAQAQADNDLARAQALYDQAREDEATLRQNQLDAGKLMASAGDYSILANIYGLTPEQVAMLSGESKKATGGAASYVPPYTPPVEDPETDDPETPAPTYRPGISDAINTVEIGMAGKPIELKEAALVQLLEEYGLDDTDIAYQLAIWHDSQR